MRGVCPGGAGAYAGRPSVLEGRPGLLIGVGRVRHEASPPRVELVTHSVPDELAATTIRRVSLIVLLIVVILIVVIVRMLL